MMVIVGWQNSKRWSQNRNLERMARNHAVQHRQRSEAKEVELKRSVQELRAENQKLKRENARLRRENEKILGRADFSVFSDEAEIIPKKTVEIAEGCPKACGVELRKIPTPFNRVIVVCPECMWRKVEDQSDKK